MKKIVYIFFSILFYQLSFLGVAQNLVLNPSFEDTIKCPFTFLIDSSAYNWTRPIGHTGTPDHFHTCNSASFSIPVNDAGNQDTCKGQSYAGIIVYRVWANNIESYREYLTGSLLNPLDSNICYKISLKYSLGETSQYTINNLGFYFSDSIPLNNSIGLPYNSMNYSPQIEVNQWTNDEENWSKIERFYQSNGGERNITIGNFLNNNSTDTLFVADRAQPNNTYISYLYIDDIIVEAVQAVTLPQLQLGGDTTLCIGDSLVFNAPLPNGSVYVWNNLKNDSIFTIDSSGTYWLEGYNGCSYTSDTIHVEFVQPEIELGNDTLVCKRESLTIGNEWNDNRTAYIWNTGETTSHVTASDSGKYWLKVNIAQCEDVDTIHIAYHIPENAQLVQLQVDTSFCLQGELIAPFSEWTDHYDWNTEETTRGIEIMKSGIYEVYAENECTESISTFDVTVESLEEGLSNYNIFTPNKDGENELFTIYEGSAEDYNLQIYNRWGKLIWETDNPVKYWDGGGVSDGVYYYHLSFTNCLDELVELRGTVSLMR